MKSQETKERWSWKLMSWKIILCNMGRCHLHLQRCVEAINALCTFVHQAHSYLSSPHQLTAFKSIRVSSKISSNKKIQKWASWCKQCVSPSWLWNFFLLLMKCPLNQASAVLCYTHTGEILKIKVQCYEAQNIFQIDGCFQTKLLNNIL